MKKYIAIILALATMLIVFSSCDQFVGKDDVDPNAAGIGATGIDWSNSTINITNQTIPSINMYEAIPESQLVQVGETITDKEYNYFYFKLGTIKNVPIYYDNAYNHNGTASTEYAWSKSSVSENIYSEVSSNSISTATTAETSLSFSTEASASLTASYGGASANLGIKASQNLSTSLGTTSEISHEESFTRSVNETIENSHSRVVTIDKDAPVGYYRYVIFGDVDVYAALVCKISDQSITYTYVSTLKEDSLFDTFKYSEKNDFSENNTDAMKLKLTQEMLDSLSIDFFDTTINNYVKGYVFASARVLQKEGKIKIEDDGYYGLAQIDKADEMNLSSMIEYMTPEYQFTFKVAVNSESAKNFWGFEIEGYREVHLYDRRNTPFDREISADIARNEYGWLGEIVWDEDSSFYEGSFTVSGDKCKDYMYIYYDAHGNDDDTWYLTYISVDVSVTKAN